MREYIAIYKNHEGQKVFCTLAELCMHLTNEAYFELLGALAPFEDSAATHFWKKAAWHYFECPQDRLHVYLSEVLDNPNWGFTAQARAHLDASDCETLITFLDKRWVPQEGDLLFLDEED